MLSKQKVVANLTGKTIVEARWYPEWREPDKLILKLDDGSTVEVYAMYRLLPKPDYYMVLSVKEGE